MTRARGEAAASAGEGRALTSVSLNLLAEAHLVNPWGTVHGGEIMRFMDSAAGYAGMKHCKGGVMTACVRELNFIKPVPLNSIMTCRADVVSRGNRSMEVAVTLDVEPLLGKSLESFRAAEGVFVVVALKNERCRSNP